MNGLYGLSLINRMSLVTAHFQALGQDKRSNLPAGLVVNRSVKHHTRAFRIIGPENWLSIEICFHLSLWNRKPLS
jgi:hypothetical protein